MTQQQQERWVSGLNHRFAKPAKGVTLSEGSNPSLSAIKSLIIIHTQLTRVLFFYHESFKIDLRAVEGD